MFTLTLLIILNIVQCKKESGLNRPDREGSKNTLDMMTEDSSSNIDFQSLENKISQSTVMDVEVFFAISVLHKRYISQFLDEVKDLSEDEQKKFFLKKKDEFFHSIKYTEAQYNSFMQNNMNKMDEYIGTHPELQSYLTTLQ